MRIVYTGIVLLLLPFFSYCQPKTYEIFGKIDGSYAGKVHLIFDKMAAANAWLSAEIKDGQFHFKGTVPQLPILAILRLSGHSTFVKVYIDSLLTHIDCTNSLNIEGKDTIQHFKVATVRGSATSSLLLDFQKKQQEISSSDLTNEQKTQALHAQLSSFIKQYPKIKVSAYLLSQTFDLSYKQAKENSALLDVSLHQSTEWRSVQMLLEQLYKPQFINTLFHDVVLKDQHNNAVETKSLNGNLTLVVLWASWCVPCRLEHPDFNRFYSSYKARGLQIVGVSLDKSKEAWIKAIEKDKLTWPQLIDEKDFEGELAKHYGIIPLPANFLLDKDRKIIGIDLSVSEIEEMIGRLLP